MKREPRLYHSDAHLPRLQRLRLWLWETPAGRACWFYPGMALGLAPVYWLGVWWFAVLVALGFAADWWSRR